ncbi:MAG: beta-lactamase domain protein [Chloroflexi bacterium]|nr:beta-lactamase domain protein [Chloroflexota bacterium]
MDLTVIGSGAAYPDVPGTASSSYLVELDGELLLLDMGQGAFAGLAGRTEPADLVAIVVSHLHPDHFVDLVALRHYLLYEWEPPRRVRILAPAGLASRLDGLAGEPGFTAAALDVEDRAEGRLVVGPFALETRRVTHAGESFAVRVSPAAEPAAPSLVFSGDCGRLEDLVPLVRPGDTLLAEVSFGPGPVPVGALHLDAPAVGALAAATRPSRVLLTHLQMRRDAARTVGMVRERFDGPVDLARDGARYRV